MDWDLIIVIIIIGVAIVLALGLKLVLFLLAKKGIDKFNRKNSNGKGV